MKPTKLSAGSLLAAMLVAAGPGLRGQTAAQDSTSKENETVVLSPFEVSSENDHGYSASSTLAGSRLRTDLRDVGAAISVVTKDFLNDTGVTNAGELLTYTTNTEVAGVHGNYSGFGNGNSVNENLINPQSTTRVRGLDNADNTRDYFLSSIPFDSYNIDRVDTVRGPNSILYGLGSPAGIINTSLNDALFKNQTSIEARYDRFGSYRGSVDANVVLLPGELAIRFDGLYDDSKYEQRQAFSKTNRQYLALKYMPKILNTEHITTTIKANFEHGKVDSDNPVNSPPEDAITPWFDPTKGNKFVSDPIGSWTANGLGPTLTSHGIVTGQPSGGAQQSLNGDANPYYNPWIGVMGDGAYGLQSRTTYLTGYQANTPQGLTYWQPTISVGPDVSKVGKAINGIPYNQVNGVTTFANYANNVKLPGYNTGLYKNTYITDTSIFDYYHNLIYGDNARQWQGWTSYNLSLAQTFFDGRLGYEAVGQQERYHNGQWNLFGEPGGIGIVTDQYNVDGSINQNFGKPFIAGNGQYNNSSEDDTRKDYRLTAYGELRGSDLFGRDSFLGKLIGRQRFTGLLTTDKHYQENKAWQLYATDAGYDVTYQDPGTNVSLQNFNPSIISFLGPSLANANSASGANLGVAGRVNLPLSGTIPQFIPKWIADPSVDPNGVWTPPVGAPGAINADNPANYQGWTNVPVNILSAQNGDISQLYRYGQKQETDVSSKAAIWQGFFADGAIVPMFGIRKDTVKTSNAQPTQMPDGMYDLSDPSYKLGKITEESGTTKTYSLVLHLPEQIRSKLPLGMDFSVFYNQSQNFQPGSGRVDLYNAPLADPNGKTKDYGVLISFLDQKVTLKVNKFKTNISAATDNALGGLWYIGGGVERDWMFDQFYKYDYGQDYQRRFYGWNSQTQAQADAQQNAATAAWDTFLQDPDVQKLEKVWGIAKNPNDWKNLTTDNVTPSGFTATEDTQSKGYEVELTTQVTKQWTMTANVSHTTATVNNVGGTALSAWVNKFQAFMQGPGGDIRLWYGGSTYLARDDWNGNFYNSWSQGQIGAGSDVSELRPWHVNLITNYRFDRASLKGFNIGGAYRWESQNILSYPTTLDTEGNYHFDLGHPFKGDANTAFDFWAGYDFKPGKKTTWRIQLNVRNAFASKDLIPVTVQYDGTPAAYRIPEPMDWELTTRITF